LKRNGHTQAPSLIERRRGAYCDCGMEEVPSEDGDPSPDMPETLLFLLLTELVMTCGLVVGPGTLACACRFEHEPLLSSEADGGV
jgi:hypothetical protein